MIDKWDYRFLDLARLVASWSKDPSTKTGAVIVRPDRTIASVGFNGFPRGGPDDPELLNDREEKYSRIIHCEMNAVIAAKESLVGYTLYTWPFLSCDRCATHMVQAGITRCVAPPLPGDLFDRWGDSVAKSVKVFRDHKVEVDIVTDYGVPDASCKVG